MWVIITNLFPWKLVEEIWYLFFMYVVFPWSVVMRVAVAKLVLQNPAPIMQYSHYVGIKFLCVLILTIISLEWMNNI